ncbi:MAG: flippase-like domain-containing protein [Betaproteobacteria bacterium]|nr:MAG: flippase-like domain-containing protein [Betaproteobacteria bacterium]
MVETDSKRPVFRAAAIVLRVLVSGVLIWWCLRQVGLETLRHGLGRVNYTAAAAAIIILLAQLVLNAWRWRLVCAALGHGQPSPRNALRWCGLSLLLSQVLPSTIGGDAYRIGAFSRQAGLLAAARTVVHDRLIGMMALAAVAALTSSIALSVSGFSIAFASMLAFSGAIFLLLAGGAAFGRHVLQRIPYPVARRFGDELRAFRTVYQSPIIFFVSVAVQVLTLVAVVAIHMGSGRQDAETWQFIVVTPGAMLASAMPVSLGGWGVREGAMAFGFRAFDTAPDTPILVSVAYGLMLLVTGLLGSILWSVLRSGRSAHVG